MNFYFLLQDHKFQELNAIENNDSDEYETKISNSSKTSYKNTDNPIGNIDNDDDNEVSQNKKEMWLKPITLRELKSRLLKEFIHKYTHTICPVLYD